MKKLEMSKMEVIEGGRSTYCRNMKKILNGGFQGDVELYIYALELYAEHC
ncbi:MAG: hypothetical protein LW721_18000 [Flammeovirgaceae bacterium]|jgi:hypothetical protein|nr:hypothetical protein [Flammeovirgaceae bacterium]